MLTEAPSSPPTVLTRVAPVRARASIAVIGSGIAGLSAAWLLARRHRVTLYEAAPQLGGHSHTVEVRLGARTIPVDTGFMVYNEAAYPELTALFRHLGVATAPTDMSFSVSVAGGELEYVGSARPSRLFAQRRNLVRPRFWRMLADLVRFYRAFVEADARQFSGLTLGDLLARGGYGRSFRDHHLLPMAAAIWSGSFRSIVDFPAAPFLAFCRAHGLLRLKRRVQWRTLQNRSRDYVGRMAADLDSVYTNAPVSALRRRSDGVEVVLGDGRREGFRHCIVATHADAALRLLADPTADERQLLGAFSFRRNHAILHGDPALMPKNRACWSSWNSIADAPAQPGTPLFVTYWLNRLQGLDPAMPLFLSLDATRRPRPDTVIAAFDYDHPQFNAAAVAAQPHLHRIQGVRNTWYCGAWTGYGFHEDGLVSAMAVASALGVEAPWRVRAPDRIRRALRAPA
jgi:hypothetical protein